MSKAYDQPMYQILAQEVARRERLSKADHVDYFDGMAHTIRVQLDQLARDFLPSGSGCDAGTDIVWEDMRPNRLVLNVPFHHMDENGFYDDWTYHKVTIRPCLQFGFTMKIDGRNRNEIKDYLADLFDDCLRSKFRLVKDDRPIKSGRVVGWRYVQSSQIAD